MSNNKVIKVNFERKTIKTNLEIVQDFLDANFPKTSSYYLNVPLKLIHELEHKYHVSFIQVTPTKEIKALWEECIQQEVFSAYLVIH